VRRPDRDRDAPGVKAPVESDDQVQARWKQEGNVVSGRKGGHAVLCRGGQKELGDFFGLSVKLLTGELLCDVSL